MEAEQHDFLWKIVVIGDSGVGKSNLIGRYTKDQFRVETKTTIGVEFGHKSLKIDNKEIKAQIWDTAGQERFRALTRGYYRGAFGALLVYSITNKSSFENCEVWLEELVQHADPGIMIMLVGNKADKDLDASTREVKTEEGLEFSQRHKLLFMETSAKDNVAVSEAFEKLIREIGKIHISETPVEEHDEEKIQTPQTTQVLKLDSEKHKTAAKTDSKAKQAEPLPGDQCAC
jgi:small GTP-binding protein